MLIDNKKDWNPSDEFTGKTVWDFINQVAGKTSNEQGEFDVVTGYFTLRALAKLYKEIPEGDEYKIVSSELVQNREPQDQIVDLLNEERGVEAALQLDEVAEDAKKFLQRNSVQIKAITKAFCHAKCYLFKNKDKKRPSFYITGSSNLTDSGLGLNAENSNVELNVAEQVLPTDSMYKEIESWFSDIWENKAVEEIAADPKNPKSEKISVKQYFINLIDDYFKKYTPEEIYYKILFELFQADIELGKEKLKDADMALLQNSVIWNTLFNYQQNGVISLVKMLEKYNGAILADAVGLGKTFSALAVMYYYQRKGYSVLLLCPKKLEQNWKQYLRKTDSRFERDGFDYEVRFHTDLQDDRLERNYERAPLSWLQKREKTLVVIDESHNLRNDDSSRYKMLMDEIVAYQKENGERFVKVLELSATPINNRFKDLRNQFKLIAHNDDKAFNTPDFEIESLDNLFRDSERKFSEWCENDIRNRKISDFINSLSPKFFKLTDKLIVARTRDLIEHTLGENLGFPKKGTPQNEYDSVESFGKYKTVSELHNDLLSLSLTAYQPTIFMKNENLDKKDWQDNIFRERFLVKMMLTLFLKRLESSWISCYYTIEKVLQVHKNTLALVNDFINKKSTGEITPEMLEDEDDDRMSEFSLRNATIKLSKMENIEGFKKGLEYDVNKLTEIFNNICFFKNQFEEEKVTDPKLEKLVSLVNSKKLNKKNNGNKKVLIFTAYKDTALYIYDQLLRKSTVKNIACVTGDVSKLLGRDECLKDFTSILQRFAPYTKLYNEKDWSKLYDTANIPKERYDENKERWNVGYEEWVDLVNKFDEKTALLLKEEVDILIATDCLSEGQNLQDADLVINYDIHWNPVRLIQRFGRIDRIGSRNTEINSVNFWPSKDLDQYLKLQGRVEDRISAMTLVGVEVPQDLTSEIKSSLKDNPLVDKSVNKLLQDLQNNNISDIESTQTLSMKDFSLETYRQDLANYLEKMKDTYRNMPNGIFSGFHKLPAENIPESLVAVVGYPRRKPTDKSHRYSSLYLMCQPVDNSKVSIQELNQSQILEFLRRNKDNERFVPDWITTSGDERLQNLSRILQDWMKAKVKPEATKNIKDKLSRRKINSTPENCENILLEEKFQLQNFDLIVWEYVSK